MEALLRKWHDLHSALYEGLLLLAVAPLLPSWQHLLSRNTPHCSDMLKQSSSKKSSHVVWDEENLKVNAEIQKEYSGIKVDEPKTPYHRPLSADDEFQGFDEDMKPLELDEGRLVQLP